MAKLSANGVELMRLDLLTRRLSYLSNGKVLEYFNGAWSHYGKLREASVFNIPWVKQASEGRAKNPEPPATRRQSGGFADGVWLGKIAPAGG